MKKKITAIIMTAAVLIGAAVPAAAYSTDKIDGLSARWQQYCGKFWWQWRSPEPEPEPEEDNPASHLIVPSIDALESAIDTMNNLCKPRWN